MMYFTFLSVDLLKKYLYIIKLKAPLNKDYDCRRINKYNYN